MAALMNHFEIKAALADGVVRLEQKSDHGERDVIELGADQFLTLADKVRGIARPDPEAEESRKLRVLLDMLEAIICENDFRSAVVDGQRGYIDWLEKLDGLHTLAVEYAHGLQPNDSPAEATPAKAANAQQDLLGGA